MLTLSAIRLKEHPCTHKEPLLPMRGNGWSFTQLHQMEGDFEIAVTKMVTNMLCHYDQEERQTDGSRPWDNIKPTLVREFARRSTRF